MLGSKGRTGFARTLALTAAAGVAMLAPTLAATPAHAETASVTLVADITNDSGGRAQPGDVTMTVTVGGADYAFESNQERLIPGLTVTGSAATLGWKQLPVLGGYTGSWLCERTDVTVPNVTVATLTLAAGQEWVCTLSLADGPGIAWNLVDSTDESTPLPGSEWSLKGKFADGSDTKLVADCLAYNAALCIPLRDQDLRAGFFRVGYAIPGETYRLSQTIPPNGYAKVGNREVVVAGDAPDVTNAGPIVDRQMLTAAMSASVTAGVFTAVQSGAVSFGETILYTITLHNLNTKALADVVITNPVPGGLVLDQSSLTCTPGCGTPAISEHQVSVNPPVNQTDIGWTIASLPAGAIATATYKARLPYPATTGAATWRGVNMSRVVAKGVGELPTPQVTLNAFKAASRPSLVSEVGSEVSIWLVVVALVLGAAGLGLIAMGLKRSRN